MAFPLTNYKRKKKHLPITVRFINMVTLSTQFIMATVERALSNSTLNDERNANDLLNRELDSVMHL